MRIRFVLTAVVTAAAALSTTSPALADDPWADVMASPASPAEPPATRPATRAEADSGVESPVHANRTLLRAGTAVFFAGYAPAFAAALPALGGIGGRVFFDVLTGGLHEYFSCQWTDEGEPDHGIPSRSGTYSTYFCDAPHGGIQLLLPIAGPLLFAGNHPQDSALNPTGAPLPESAKLLLYGSATLQGAGLAILVAGLAARSRETAPASTERSAQPHVEWTPMLSANTVGVGARVVGW